VPRACGGRRLPVGGDAVLEAQLHHVLASALSRGPRKGEVAVLEGGLQPDGWLAGGGGAEGMDLAVPGVLEQVQLVHPVLSHGAHPPGVGLVCLQRWQHGGVGEVGVHGPVGIDDRGIGEGGLRRYSRGGDFAELELVFHLRDVLVLRHPLELEVQRVAEGHPLAVGGEDYFLYFQRTLFAICKIIRISCRGLCP